MTPQSIRLCSVDDLAAGQVRRCEVGGKRIALVRIGDDFYAIGDRCSHADVSLSEGEVMVKDLELECWKHGSTFSLLTGVPSCMPAVTSVPVYRVVVVGNEVTVELDDE